MVIGTVGCRSNENSSSSNEDEIVIPTPEKEVIEYTNYKLVDNGSSDYRIVVADDANENELFAAEEIQELFGEATSVELAIVKESETTYSETAKLIILGDTSYTEKTGVEVSSIPYDGFTLQNDGSNLFIIGEDYGVLYGAYEFLNKSVGYEYYVANSYALNKNVKNLYMPKLAYSDAPDFLYRGTEYQFYQQEISRKEQLRTRAHHYTDYFMSENNFWACHNSFHVLPKAEYQEAHPEWYADDGLQLCYTAHGNEEELELMRAEVLEKFKTQAAYYFDRGIDKPAIAFTQQDTVSNQWCNCDACQNILTTKSAESASIILFLNPVARQLKEWIDEEYPGREVTIVFFAYQATMAAPVKKVNGESIPYDDSVVMEDNIAVWIAATTGNYIRNIDDERNTMMYNLYLDWSVVASQIYSWTYDTNFHHYFIWYDTFGALQDLYRYLKDCNVKFLHTCVNVGYPALTKKGGQTGFNAFKAALTYQLRWDVETDVKSFTDRFFNTFFGAASKPMRAYYESFRSWSEYLKSELDYNGNIYFDGHTKGHYPKQVLNGWYENIEEAYASIEPLKTTSPEEYQILHNRITEESMAIRYYLIQYHGDTFTASELRDRKLSFREDAIRLNYPRRAENISIDSLWSDWGV